MRAYLVVFALMGVAQAGDVSVISKITNSLNAMKDSLEKEGVEDSKDMHRMNCWCDATKADAAKAIKDNEATSASSAAAAASNQGIVAASAAASSAAKSEMEDLQKKIAAKTQQDAAAMASFAETEHTRNTMIASLSKAIQQVKEGQDNAATAANPKADGFLQSVNSEKVEELIQQLAPAGEGAYASRAGGIMGVLQNTLENYQQDKADAAEAENGRHGATLMELSAYNKSFLQEERTEATESSRNTQAQAALEAAVESKKNADAVVANNKDKLKSTKETCFDASNDFNQREQDRSAEMDSIANGLAILEANRMDLLNNANFLQVEEVARRVNPKTSLIATQMLSTLKRNGPKALQKVTDEIATMVGHLENERAEEAAQHNACVETSTKMSADKNTATNNRDTAEAARDNAEAGRNAKNDLIQNLEEKIHKAIASVKKASEERSAESMSYQKKIDNQNNVIAVIRKVESALGASYKVQSHVDNAAKKGRSALLLQDDVATGEVNMRHTERKQQDSKAVMTLIQNVRLKSEADMHNMNAEEMENREEYGKFMRDTVGDIRRFQDSAAANSAVAAELTGTFNDKAGDFAQYSDETDGATKALDEHDNGPCKNLRAHFNKWQSARTSEIDGLKSAMSVFDTAMEQYKGGAGNA